MEPLTDKQFGDIKKSNSRHLDLNKLMKENFSEKKKSKKTDKNYGLRNLKQMENIFLKCDKCGNNIRFGEPHVSINRNAEYAERVGLGNRIEIQVIDAIQLVTLCDSCGNDFNSDIISEIIKEFTLQK